ncbi:MAG: zinc ribbon domain-containing protein [Clostridium sp.]
MFCRECGNKLDNKMKFCNKCGSKIQSQEHCEEQRLKTNSNSIGVINYILGGIVLLGIIFAGIYYSGKAKEEGRVENPSLKQNAPISESNSSNNNKTEVKDYVETSNKRKVDTYSSMEYNYQLARDNSWEVVYYIDNIFEENGERYIAVDVAFMDFSPSDGIGGYEVINDNNKIRTFKISNSARYTEIENKESSDSIVVDYDSFTRDTVYKWGSNNGLFNLEFNGDKIVNIDEIFIP